MRWSCAAPSRALKVASFTSGSVRGETDAGSEGAVVVPQDDGRTAPGLLPDDGPSPGFPAAPPVPVGWGAHRQGSARTGR